MRAHVRAHVRWPQSHAIFAREVQIGGSDIDAFIAGANNLTPEKINGRGGVLDYLNIKAEYLPDLDLLKSTAPPPSCIGMDPPKFDLEAETYSPRWKPSPLPASSGKAASPPPAASWDKKPGWA